MWSSRGDIYNHLKDKWRDKHDEARLVHDLLLKCEHVLVTHKGASK